MAQPKQKKTRILFLLDASSSMTYPWNGGYTRFEVASNILLKVMDSVYSINNEIEFAVRAYGTIYPAQLQNCVDTRLEVPFNFQNTNQIKTRLRNLTPIGSSPIAFSLKKASENELNEVNTYDYSVIFITDGGESCNGDVCGVYQELLQKKISITPYIIGLDKNETLKSYYSCLGNYIEVSTPEDITKAVDLIVNANRSIIDKPKQLKLTTTFSNAPVIKDSVKPKPIVKDTPVVVRTIADISKLNFLRYGKNIHSEPVLKIVALKFKKYNKAVLHFEWEEPKKTSVVFTDLRYYEYKMPVKKGSTKISFKKMDIKKGKASLRFEYEEPKKTSPALASVAPAFIKNKIKNSQPSITIKKSNYKFPKLAKLQFEYEEPKKTSPAMVSVAPAFVKNTIQNSLPSVAVKKSNYKLPKTAKLQFEYDVPKKDTLKYLSLVKFPRRYSYAFRMPDMKPMNLKNRKAVLHFAVEEKKVVAKKEAPSAPLAAFPNNSIEFTTEVTPSIETMVQVYFKNTNGKTYDKATPMIELQDVTSNTKISSFRREMNGTEPIPQRVTPGKYNVVVKGSDDLYANNIEIKPNTITKVILKVSDGTLKFTYQGNIKRPVSEYKAVVNRRFAAGATVMQRCNDELKYEPGTYYIEINTLPVSKYSIDLEFDAVYEIQISEPGTLAIMNSTPLGKVQVQYMLGDKYMTFYTMNITGEPDKQRLQLLPYSYKLVYLADPKMPQEGNKELMIKVNSNQQVEIELN